MKGLWLFLKSRHAIALLVWLAGAAAGGRALGPRGYVAGEEVPILIPWVAFLPLVTAYAVATAAVSPLPVLERTGRRRVAMFSRLYLVTASALGIASLWFATEPVPPPFSTVAAIRDYLGLLGVSLVCLALLGGAAAWTVPCGAVFMAVVLRNGDTDFAPLEWLLADDGDRGAFAVAFGLLMAGGAATWSRMFLRRGVRDE